MGYLVAFLVALVLPLAALMGANTRVGTLHGDLTRLANVATHDFGRRPPPDAPPLQMLKVDPAAPAVLVLGDSFSRWNVWQSQWMTWRGRRDVLTYHWDRIGGPACLQAWAGHLRARYPQARQLVVQVVERSFKAMIEANPAECQRQPQGTQPEDSGDALAADVRNDTLWPPPDPHHVLRAWAAHFKSFGTQTRRGQVVVTPLNRSDLFTSRRPDLLLTYIDDQYKVHWQADAMRPGLERLQALRDALALQGITLIMAVVPDKSTLYAPYYRDPANRVLARVDPWQLLQQGGIRQAPLLPQLQRALPATRDLYMPDDTHLGFDGFRLMAAAIRDEAERP